MTTAAILLAAGQSRRLGQPKQLVRLANETLLERVARVAHAAKLAPVVVVLGALAEVIEAHVPLPGAIVLRNTAWEEGMAASVRVGIEAVPAGVDGAIVMTCDQPAVTPEHLCALVHAAHETAKGAMVASSYAGRQGVPAYFPRTCFTALLGLRGDRGARDLLRDARSVDLLNGEVDVDTPEALALAQHLFGTGVASSG